ncbi:MAG TPA: hypothetical protein VHS33_06145 [Sphingomicrobium sp.]|jgi:hypothetical protein|nr:hypothetical protein [Sphingomicrobium sp.]
MKRVVLALIFVSSAAVGAEKPVVAAFHAAFGKNDSVVLKKQGQLKESVKYTPGELVQASFGPVLLSPGEVEDASHVNSGKLAVFYLRSSAKGFDVVKRFVPATQTGSFGKIVDWSVSRSFGDNPVVMVNGAGNWQGYACSVTTLLELGPDGPKQLVTVPMTYDNSQAIGGGNKLKQFTGRIDNIKPGKSFDVIYFGSKDFTDHYVRTGDTYAIGSGVKSRMETC